jgi:peroxin-3
MPPTAWQKRFRRLAVAAGTISSLYLLLNYALDRMREARVRALKDRQVKDRWVYSMSKVVSMTDER